jgi:hypothetical protein
MAARVSDKFTMATSLRVGARMYASWFKSFVAEFMGNTVMCYVYQEKQAVDTDMPALPGD